MNLNDKQSEAVQYIEGPLLILAGAGSGKTRVIIERIANIIKSGKAQPEEIMAVTFTNKAAKELKLRLIKKVGEAGKFITAGTFHSICAKILRKYADRIGYQSNFVIYDTDDKNRVIKNCLKELELDSTNYPYKKISSFISNLKNKMVYPDNFEIREPSYYHEKIKDLYELYQKELLSCNAFDFDDLLCMVIKLFDTDEEIKFMYQNMIKYIHVDEYQDTNFVQDSLVTILSELYGNICVVGDEDQSIYSWRGADIRNILEFKNRFRNCKVIQLEQNYRSTSNILDVANSVITNNTQRLGKTLFTELGEGEKVVLISTESDIEEGNKTTDIVTQLVGEGNNLKDICFLYRTNAQSRVLEESLRKKGYSYSIVGGVKFYDRKEIKDILAYIRLILNSKDNISFERAINFPARGIGKTTVKKFKNTAFDNEISLMDSLKELDQIERLSAKAKKGIAAFQIIISTGIQMLQEKEDAEEICQYIFEKSGLKQHYKMEAEKSESTAFENIMEFLASVANFVEENENGSLQEFMESVALLSDIDKYNESDDKITLMTVHSAKGLEFKNVIITGLNEGLFPIIRDNIANNEIEEERRLFYVATTRAQKKLYLSYYKYRKRSFGSFDGYSPSRFLDGLPEEVIDRREFDFIDDSIFKDEKRSKYEYHKKSKKVFINTEFKENDWVSSKQFGEGKILMIEGEGNKTTVMVDFDDYGMKKLLLKYANLEKNEY